MSRLGPLAEREFRLLFLGRTTSFAGNAFASVALAFAVLDLTGSKSDLGFVLAAREVPQVIFVLAGGIWADRLPRHHVMVGSNVLSGATQAGVAALLLSGQARIWELVVLAAANGTSSAFFFPASQGIVPQTVPMPMLQRANALLRLGLNASWIGGAALGGVVVAATSPGTAIAVDAGGFLLAAAFVGAMRLPAGPAMEGGNFLAELAEGWQEFRSRPWLWAIVLQFSIVNAAGNGTENVLGPAVAKAHLGGAGAWGLVLATQSLGLVAGGLLLLRVRPRRILLTATFGVLLGPLVLVTLAVPLPLAAVVPAAFVAGFGIEIFGVLWDTAMQQEIPGDKLSRVASYDALGSIVLIPIGLSVSGPIAAAVGTRATFLGATALILAATLAVLLVEDVRTLERSDILSPEHAPDAAPA